jgi:hypothetical protein
MSLAEYAASIDVSCIINKSLHGIELRGSRAG